MARTASKTKTKKTTKVVGLKAKKTAKTNPQKATTKKARAVKVPECTDEIIKKVPRLFTDGKCEIEVSFELGVTPATWNSWRRKNKDFNEAVEQGLHASKAFLARLTRLKHIHNLKT